jgi:hypothetical protein
MGNWSLREKTVRNIKEKIKQLVFGGLLSINKTIIRTILKSYKKAPGLYSTVDWRHYNSRSYNFKNSKIFHLGDGINFSLLLSNDNSYTLNAYKILDELINSFNVNNSLERNLGKREILVIKPIGDLVDIYYFLTKMPILLIDLMDIGIEIKIPNYLMQIIDHEEINLGNFKCINILKYQSQNYLKSENYIVMNLELASGSFRVKEEHYKTIWNAGLDYALENDCEIIIVGVHENRYSWMSETKKLNIIDLRCKLSINELIKVIGSNSCSAIFTFDNLIMHIANIFEKKCFIKFRGKKNLLIEEFHYKIVNNSYRERDNINYL